jgi:hypothetical protein
MNNSNYVVNELMFSIDKLEHTRGRIPSIQTVPLPLEYIPNTALSEVFYQLSLATRK